MKGGDQKLGLPAGFRFHPTDEELVMHYLCPKCAKQPIVVPIIAEIDLYKFDPWQLPGMALYGEKEWYFFSPRDRKYPNGSRPNRAAGRGYWKATGADKPVGKPKTMGIKKALVFYSGKAPRGLKTNWIMHEYRLANIDRSAANNKNNLRLDDWVLCRIYNKKGIIEKHYIADHQESIKYMEDEEQKPKIISTIAQVFSTMPPQSLPNSNSRSMASQVMNGYLNFDTCHESVPRLHTDESSGSEQVLSPEFTSCDKQVQSVPKWNDFDIRDLDYDHQLNYMDGFHDDDPFGSLMQHSNQLFPLQDMFVCMQKPL